MPKYAATPTNVERRFAEDEIIVSKTDTTGRLTYANDVFLRIADFTEDEVLGEPHSILRHPDMPRCIFQLLWERISNGKEIFAYVKNMTKGGDFYWVLAHVTPTFDSGGRVLGYHSNRRVPDRSAIAKIEPIYRELLSEENRHADRKTGMQAAAARLNEMLKKSGQDYDQFVFALAA